MVTEKAYAKINLYLDVLSRRDNGFHDILSVMHSVTLADRLYISAQAAEVSEISLSVKGAELPCDERNIAYLAARSYLDKSEICSKINIEIEKNIPIGAGLAGGSADAAAVLRGLNKIYNKLSEGELFEIAASLGSDVPFCLTLGSAVCEGRGEIMTPVALPGKNFVIAIGDERVNTAFAYSELDRLHDNFSDRPPSREIKERLLSLSDFEDELYNIFEETAPIGVGELKERLSALSARAVLMSGSGPSVFGIFDSEEQAKAAAAALNSEGYTAHFAKSLVDNS